MYKNPNVPFFFLRKKNHLYPAFGVYCKRSHVYKCNWFVTNTPVYIRSVYQWYA